MRQVSDLYFQAAMANAAPLCLAFVGTNYGLRCFGKHMPTVEQVGSTLENIIEWDARVLTFGTFRQSASQQGENILQMLVETEMSSYTLECDDADQYFTEIASREIFINGDLYLYQGFDYPSFDFADFLPLFYGKIQKYTSEVPTMTFYARQAIIAEPADDPYIDLTVTYADEFDGS